MPNSYYYQFLCVHTEPPTAVRNLTVTDITSNTITIEWEAPVRTGRPDFYYVVENSDPDDISILIRHSNNELKDTSYIVDGLRPDTKHIIRVSVHNGVSDLDVKNADERRVVINARTEEGRKKLCIHTTPCTISLAGATIHLCVVAANCTQFKKW